MNTHVSTSLVIFIFLLIVPRLSAEDWPQWRGPRLNLASNETEFQLEWPEAGPKIAWKTAVGIGYSSVSVVGDRVWTMGYAGEKEHVYCLSVETGEELWKHSYDGELVNKLHKGGPGATPTVDGDHVYSAGKQGQLFCLAKDDGKVIWKFDARQGLNVKVPEWGFTGSPVIVDDLLFLDFGRIVAIHKSDGSLAWKTGPAKAGYGSATPLIFDGQSAIAVLNNEGLNILATEDGSELAFHEWKTDYETNATSPIVIASKENEGKRTIFLSTGYKRGCTLLEIDGDGLKTVYEERTLSNHMNNSVLHAGHLYGFDGNSHRGRSTRLACLDLATGQSKWSQLGMGCGSLMLAGDKLVVLTEEGELVLAEANSEKCVELTRAKVIDRRCWTVPVLSAGRVFCRNDVGDLVCVDLRAAK